MKLIVGLGNPGSLYAATRHNVGFNIVDKLARRFGLCFKSGKGPYVYGDIYYKQKKIVLLKPMTYMNLSGEAVSHALNYRKIDSRDLLVVVDDLNLPVGKLRGRAKGSSGGHKGLNSIIAGLNTDYFSRLRIGIQHPEQDRNWADYVLEPFARAEREVIDETLEIAADACLYWVENGIENMMSKFN